MSQLYGPNPLTRVGMGELIVRAADAVDWQLPDVPERFLEFVRHMGFGLRAEDELLAVLCWLGRVELGHKIGQTVYSVPGTTEPVAPDLFVVMRRGERLIPLYVEVKSTEDLRLRLTDGYRERLDAYRAITGHPVLIGWRPRPVGFWLLFDPRSVETQGGYLDVGQAAKNDLMGCLAGDFWVGLKAGCGLRVELKEIAPRVPAGRGYQVTVVVENAYFHDPAGTPLPALRPELVGVLLSSVQEDPDSVDQPLVQSYTVPVDYMTRAQVAFRAPLAFRCPEGDEIRWRQVLKQLHGTTTRDSVLAAVEAEIGGLVHILMDQVPSEWPEFLRADE
jgi:hypothetical protein